MSVISYADKDLFVFRVIKSHVSNPSQEWANSYEVQALAAGNSTNLTDLGDSIVAFEKAIHSQAVQFVRLLISTWQADSVPYDPLAFITVTLTGVGTRETSGDLLGLSNCLAVARPAPSGRFGHLFYRGVLTEDDVEAPAGKTILQDKAAIQSEIGAALTSSALDSYLDFTITAELEISLVSADGETVRPVNTFVVQGVSQLPTDHGWFNRTSP